MIAYPINVITPYRDFKLDNNFPLQLKEIILGPKCPEKKINKYQIETLLKNIGKENVVVSISDINNYR